MSGLEPLNKTDWQLDIEDNIKAKGVDIHIFYAKPGEVCPEGCWAAWINFNGFTWLQTGYSIPELLIKMAFSMLKDFETDNGLVG